MDEKRDSVILHLEDFEDIENMKDSDAGKLLKSILAYVSTGALPDRLGVQAKTMFGYIRRHIDRDQTYYESVKLKRKTAGKKGGRPRKVQAPEEATVSDDGNQKAKESKDKQTESKEKQKNQMVFSESKKSYPDTDTDTDPDTDPDPDPDTDPDNTRLEKQRGRDSESGKAARIRFLETYMRLHQCGAFDDPIEYRRYAEELKRLKGEIDHGNIVG